MKRTNQISEQKGDGGEVNVCELMILEVIIGETVLVMGEIVQMFVESFLESVEF